MAEKLNFKTYNQTKQDALFAVDLVKKIDPSTKLETLVLKNNNASEISTEISVGRADTVSASITAASGTASLGIKLLDAAGTEINTATVAKIVNEDATQTLTNKTIDADDNTISDLTLSNLKSGVLQTSVRSSAAALDTNIASEKAVRTELDKKLDVVALNGTALNSSLADGVRTVSIPVASDSALGVVKVDNTTVFVDSNGVLSAQEVATYTITKAEAAEEGFAATYKLMKTVGTGTPTQEGASINIPKDFLVKSATVKTAQNYATGVAYTRGDIIRHSEGDPAAFVTYVVHTNVPATQSSWTDIEEKVTKVTTINPSEGEKVIIFVINAKEGGEEQEQYLFIQVGDLLTIYRAGNGMSLDVNHRFAVNLTSAGGLKFNGSVDNEKTLGVSTDGSTIDINTSGEVQIKDSGVSTVKIVDSAVTTAKINDGAVTTDKIADANVTTAKIADNNVTTTKILDANVTTGKLADGAVTTVKIADANVTTAKIADENVTTGKIADSAVTTAKIADANVTTAKLATDSVVTAKIADGNVTEAKLDTAFKRKLYEASESDGVITFTQIEANA